MISVTLPVRHIQLWVVLALALYLVLYLHDRNLYPQLNFFHSGVLSLLRLGLLLMPLLLGYLITRVSGSGWGKFLLVGLWLMLIPYTLYSITEIRHVAELCRLPQSGTYYTDSCLSDTWTLLPVLIYAVFGGGAFVFSLRHVSHHLLPRGNKRTLLLSATCLYAGFAAAFGLYSRLNTWDFLITPVQTMRIVSSTLGAENFFVNSLIFGIFAAGIVIATSHLHHVVTQNKT